MRHQITITGQIDTWADEETVRRDASMFLGDVESVHPGTVPGSVTLVSVERLPDPSPVVSAGEGSTLADQIAELQRTLDALREASRTA